MSLNMMLRMLWKIMPRMSWNLGLGTTRTSSPPQGCVRKQGLGSLFIPGLKSVVPVLGSGAGEAVNSYHGVAADLDLTTLYQSMLGQGVGM